MSFTIKNTTALLLIAMLFNTGCSHRVAFPELANSEGVLTADDKNAAYDDSAVPLAKEAKLVPAEEKIENKDLSRPSTEIHEVSSMDDVVVPAKSTPVVIEDMDLIEMDAADVKTKVVKPISESKTIIAVNKKQQTVKSETSGKTTEPNVFYLAETVYFNNGSSSVDSSYFSRLRKVVKEAKAHNGRIIVQGFASSRTRNTDIVSHKMSNLKISTARADHIAEVLVKYGMPKARVITEGLSDSRPAYQEVMPEGERLNRRAEIYIAY